MSTEAQKEQIEHIENDTNLFNYQCNTKPIKSKVKG